jgi:hypothetical protein
MKHLYNLIHCISTCISLPLLVSGIIHFNNPYAFMETIYGYRLVPESIGPFLAAILPSFLIAISIAIMFDFNNRKILFFICCILFICFIFAQASAWIRGLNISCGCFGTGDGMKIGFKTLAIPLIGLGFSLSGFLLLQKKPLNQEPKI